MKFQNIIKPINSQSTVHVMLSCNLSLRGYLVWYQSARPTCLPILIQTVSASSTYKDKRTPLPNPKQRRHAHLRKPTWQSDPVLLFWESDIVLLSCRRINNYRFISSPQLWTRISAYRCDISPPDGKINRVDGTPLRRSLYYCRNSGN